MKMLSTAETQALKLIENLYTMSEDHGVTRQEVRKVCASLWEMDIPSDTIIGTFIETLEEAVNKSAARYEFFGMIDYDLDVIVRHYQGKVIQEDAQPW